MRESDSALPGAEASDPSDIPTCDFCGHPGATHESLLNPEELYCADVCACIGRKWPDPPRLADAQEGQMLRELIRESYRNRKEEK